MYDLEKGIVLITNQCNMGCKYCFESRTPKRMSLNTAKDVLDYFHKSKSDTAHFTFFGGEPMLELETIIKPIYDYSMSLEKPTSFSMTTNGTLLTPENAKYLIDNKIDFMISMDGVKEIQDVERPLKNNKSSFDVVEGNVKWIIENTDYELQIRSTIKPQYFDSLYESIRYYDSIGLKRLAIIPDLFTLWTEEDAAKFQNQIEMYEKYLIECYKIGRQPLVFNQYKISFNRLYRLSKNPGYRELPKCRPGSQCGFACKGSGSIDTEGYIYGCHHPKMDEDSIWCVGNVYDGVNDSKVDYLIHQYDPMKLGNSMCPTCKLRRICDGGCKPNNWILFGDFNQVPNNYCYFNQLLCDSAYRVLKELYHKSELFDNNFYRFMMTGGY